MTVHAALLRRTGALRDGRSYLIRPTQAGDSTAVVSLRDSVAAEGEYIAASPGERSATEETLSLAGLLSQGGLSLVADVEGELAAHLLVQRRVEQAADADLAIIVQYSCRGQGLGRALMETAIEWGRAVRVRTLRLCVFVTNVRAISLYRSVGFVEDGSARSRVALPSGERELLLMSLTL